tara:strand:+ start:534 stop:770 length:237 start_codon:yes stop_codon:yes gene_type:complete
MDRLNDKEVKALMIDTDKLDVSLEEKVAIKEKQFEVAMEQDNVQMLIWLGKQYLGQSDKANDIEQDELPSGFDLKVIE